MRIHEEPRNISGLFLLNGIYLFSYHATFDAEK